MAWKKTRARGKLTHCGRDGGAITNEIEWRARWYSGVQLALHAARFCNWAVGWRGSRFKSQPGRRMRGAMGAGVGGSARLAVGPGQRTGTRVRILACCSPTMGRTYGEYSGKCGGGAGSSASGEGARRSEGNGGKESLTSRAGRQSKPDEEHEAPSSAHDHDR